MKRNLLTKSIVVSVALSALLAGCGSTSTDVNTGDDSNIQKSISGKAIDGYLKNAVVCLDLNQDGYCQAHSEPMTTTLEDGSFQLDITQEQRDNESFDEAMLLIFGGVDVDTKRDFTGKLMAPNDGSAILNVSPITTIVAKNVQKALKTERGLTKEQIKDKIKEARKKVAFALEIGEDEVGLDPVERKISGDDKLIRKALQIQKSLEAQLIAAKVNDKELNDKMEDLYEALADSLDDMEGGDKGVKKLFEKASQKESFKSALNVNDQTSEQMLRIAEKIETNLDRAFDDDALSDDLEKIAAITRDDLEKIKEGAKANDLSEVIEGIVYTPTNDWLKKYIEYDLLEIGIKPTPALVNKLKSVYKNSTKAGVLLEESEKLKDNSDAQLQEVYQKIVLLKEKKKREKEAEEARYDKEVKVDLKAIFSEKTFYVIDEDGVFALTFNADVSSATDAKGENTKLQIDGNSIYAEDDEKDKDVLTYKAQTDEYYEFYGDDGELIRFYKEKEKAESYLASIQEKFQKRKDDKESDSSNDDIEEGFKASIGFNK